MDSTITSKGQTTIPKAARDHLGVKAGDKVRYLLRPDGGMLVLPVVPASALRGMVKARETSVRIDEMEAAIAEGASERFRGCHRR